MHQPSRMGNTLSLLIIYCIESIFLDATLLLYGYRAFNIVSKTDLIVGEFNCVQCLDNGLCQCRNVVLKYQRLVLRYYGLPYVSSNFRGTDSVWPIIFQLIPSLYTFLGFLILLFYSIFIYFYLPCKTLILSCSKLTFSKIVRLINSLDKRW